LPISDNLKYRKLIDTKNLILLVILIPLNGFSQQNPLSIFDNLIEKNLEKQKEIGIMAPHLNKKKHLNIP